MALDPSMLFSLLSGQQQPGMAPPGSMPTAGGGLDMAALFQQLAPSSFEPEPEPQPPSTGQMIAAVLADMFGRNVQILGGPQSPSAVQQLMGRRQEIEERRRRNVRGKRESEYEQRRFSAGLAISQEEKRRAALEKEKEELRDLQFKAAEFDIDPTGLDRAGILRRLAAERKRQQSFGEEEKRLTREERTQSQEESRKLRSEADLLRRNLVEQRIAIERDRLDFQKKKGSDEDIGASDKSRLEEMVKELEDTVSTSGDDLARMLREGKIKPGEARSRVMRRVKYNSLPAALKEKYRQAVEEIYLPVIEQYEQESGEFPVQAEPGTSEYERKAAAGLAIPRAKRR